MTRAEAIKQIESLFEHCKAMMTSDEPVWSQDCEALKVALFALRGPTREQVENRELLSIEELNLKPGEYAVCLARRNPFSEWYPMVIKRVRNGYVCPVMEQYVTDIFGGFRIPDLKKAKEAKP